LIGFIKVNLTKPHSGVNDKEIMSLNFQFHASSFMQRGLAMTSRQAKNEFFEPDSLFRKAKEGDTMKVFIADDSPILRERLKAILSDFPEVEIAGQAQDAPKAIKSIKELKPDVVILDIRMPGGSGIDVLKDIKGNKPTPVVSTLTNYPYPEYRKKCMDLWADFFFAKSTESNQLPEAVKELIHDSYNVLNK
jgi:CheY-like chemotaxis protein